MRKVYVKVLAVFNANGIVLPRAFVWEDEETYKIDRVMSRCRAAATKTGGIGWRYKVRVGEKETYMWLDDDGRWFMETRDDTT